MADLRAYLTLGRVSNLSTVWGNVLCAWIICNGESPLVLASLLLGSSLLYVSGMYMNDLCDLPFDSRHYPQRPLPSGRVSRAQARKTTFALALLGFISIAWTGLLPSALAVGLIGLIALYNRFHKGNPLAPALMAGCRVMLYLITAATVSHQGIDSLLIGAASIMFLYVCGVTYLARNEAKSGALSYPGLILVLTPLFLSFYYRPDLFDTLRGIAIGLLAAWIALAFLRAKTASRFAVGRAIGPLLSAIPLVDLLILSSYGFATATHLATFAALFAIAVLAQRYIPAS